MMFLFIVVITWMVLTSLSRRSPWQPGEALKKRTDAEYNLIMNASNWDPEMFYEGEDGVFRNSRGEIGECLTLKQIMDRIASEGK